MKVLRLLVSAAWLLTCASAQSTLEDYFGGVDNEAYLSWANEFAEEYPSTVFVSSGDDVNEGVAVHWRVDETHIFLAVAAKAEGWVGFGFSEAGGMQGADVILFEANKPDEITDAYILEERVPLTDDCQDWTLTRSNTTDGYLIFEANRLRETDDPQDRNIVRDVLGVVQPPSRIIAAWGDSDSVSYHGPSRARGSVNWFATDPDEMASFQATMAAESEGTLEIRANNYTVKAMDTEYVSFCASWSDLVAQGAPDQPLSIVGFEPIVDEDARAHIHHFTMFASVNTNDGVECDYDPGSYYHLAYVWAPGEGPLALPDNIGAPLGPGSFQSFIMEIHYDNPNLVEGVLDSSGVRFYYTTQLREVELGVLMLADPFVSLYGSPVRNSTGLVEHSFDCPGGCSASVLDVPITVVREHLHMHATGASIRNEQIRDGQLVRTGRVDYFAFDQQGNPVVQQEPFQVMPGDAFRTVCNYNAQSGEVFGLSSQQEMCNAFLFYYPRRELYDVFSYTCGLDIGFPECEASHTVRELEGETELGRIFGVRDPEGTCPGETATGNVQATSGAFLVGGTGSMVTSLLLALFVNFY